jgi:hypothetical protein
VPEHERIQSEKIASASEIFVGFWSVRPCPLFKKTITHCLHSNFGASILGEQIVLTTYAFETERDSGLNAPQQAVTFPQYGTGGGGDGQRERQGAMRSR